MPLDSLSSVLRGQYMFLNAATHCLRPSSVVASKPRTRICAYGGCQRLRSAHMSADNMLRAERRKAGVEAS